MSAQPPRKVDGKVEELEGLLPAASPMDRFKSLTSRLLSVTPQEIFHQKNQMEISDDVLEE